MLRRAVIALRTVNRPECESGTQRETLGRAAASLLAAVLRRVFGAGRGALICLVRRLPCVAISGLLRLSLFFFPRCGCAHAAHPDRRAGGVFKNHVFVLHCGPLQPGSAAHIAQHSSEHACIGLAYCVCVQAIVQP